LKFENNPSTQGKVKYAVGAREYATDDIRRDKRLAYRYVEQGHDVDAWGTAGANVPAPKQAFFWQSEYLGEAETGPEKKEIPGVQ
jgi:hypothetical protein